MWQLDLATILLRSETVTSLRLRSFLAASLLQTSCPRPVDVVYRDKMTYLGCDSLSRLKFRDMIQYSGNSYILPLPHAVEEEEKDEKEEEE